MAMTDENTIYHIWVNYIHATDTERVIELSSSFGYLSPHGAHYSFSDYNEFYLSFNRENNRVYFVGNRNGCLQVYDVTSLENSEPLGIADGSAAYHNGAARNCYFLDGQIIVPASGGGSYLVNLSTGASMHLDIDFDVFQDGVCNYIIGGKVVSLDLNNNALIFSSLTSSAKSTISIDEKLTSNNYFSGPDGIYFWISEKGLFRIDLTGKVQEFVNAEGIERLDFAPMPEKIDEMQISADGTVAFFDNSSGLLRVLRKK